MFDLPDFDHLKTEAKAFAEPRIIMVDREGRPTTKRDKCYMWTRERFGFGWHYPEKEPVPEF